MAVLLPPVERQSGQARRFLYQARAKAAVRGSAAAMSVPVAGSMRMAALAFIDQGGRTETLWPRRDSSARMASGTRDSTDRSPGYMVCGNGEAGKLLVLHRGASIACCAFMPNSMMFSNVC